QAEKKRPTLEERQNKQYPFPDADVAEIFNFLLEAKMIELPESKRPQQADQVTDPNYCRYHRIVSHPIEKCFVFKEKVMELVRNNKIQLESEVAASNLVSMPDHDPAEEIADQSGWILVTRRKKGTKVDKIPTMLSPTRVKILNQPRRKGCSKKSIRERKPDIHERSKELTPLFLWDFFPEHYQKFAASFKSCHHV
ncbi:hypothetical protein ACXVWQ_10755, partial [Haemophilus sp. SZY H57]